MPILLWWREIIITLLVVFCLWIINNNQKLDFKAKETVLIHEKLVLDAERKTANVISLYQSQRKADLEIFTNETIKLNDKYSIALSNSNRVYEKVTTYNDRLHTTTRETVENYAKAGSTLYSECRKEYLDLGYYTAKLDAELDSKTKQPD